MAVGALAAACSDPASDVPSPYVEKTEQPTLTTLTDSVAISTGDTAYVDLQVNPYDEEINYQVGDDKCAIKLVPTSGSSANYSVLKIVPLTGAVGPGKYRVYVADMGVDLTYDVKFYMTLTDKYGRVSKTDEISLSCDCDEQTKSLLATGLTLVSIETIGGEEPTAEYISHPPGCNGATTTNETKVPGRVTVMNGEKVLYFSGGYCKDTSGMRVKIRGNTSAYGSKKPFKIKLEKKGDMLGRGSDSYKDKEWLLLRYDNQRTMAGFKVNELVGQQWTPAYRFVNLVMNGDYRGVYMLTESVKRNKDCRLDVDKSTGYIIEYDAYWWNEDVYFTNGWTSSMAYTFRYPDDEDVTESQIAYIRDYVSKTEYAIRSGDYTQYLDVTSFAGWLLGHDILGNLDLAGSNLYLTKYDNTTASKLMMANLWDFDNIYRMKDQWANIHISGAFYYPRLLGRSAFKKEYLAIWDRVSPTIFDQMVAYFDAFAASDEGKALNASIKLDRKRWGSSSSYIETTTSTAKEWFTSRKPWMENAMTGLR